MLTKTFIGNGKIHHNLLWKRGLIHFFEYFLGKYHCHSEKCYCHFDYMQWTFDKNRNVWRQVGCWCKGKRENKLCFSFFIRFGYSNL